MINPKLIPTFLRELIVDHTFPREPEPELVMTSPEQVSAYAKAGRIDGIMAFNYLFHSARISQVIQGCTTVLDLGCGPATQLAQVAQLNPNIQFIGADLSANMITDAKKHIQELNIKNVTFIQGDITSLNDIADKSMDGIISTLALHHLPTLEHLVDCFEEISRIIKPNGSLYLADFGKLKSLKSVLFFAYINANHQPHIFSLDFERSLRAAFYKSDFEILANNLLPKGANVFSTFKMPLMILIKTEDQPLSENIKKKLNGLRQSLSSRYRRDLNDIRTFFRLGGLKNDPFR